MAWIDTVPRRAANPELAELYARVADPATGQLDHILQIHSLHPEGLTAHFELYRAVMRGTPTLRAVEREFIAFAVSHSNRCEY